MAKGAFKQEIFNQFARIGKAMSNANRLEIIEFLAQGERSVEALAKLTGLAVANTSQHLQQLRQAGLVITRKEGQFVYYQLAGEDIVVLFGALRKVAESYLAEVDRLVEAYLNVRDSLEPVPRDQLLERIREGSVTVLDVRPQEEYESGHVPGAVNVPMAQLEEYLQKLDNAQEVIAYCRGPHCLLAFDAVAKLREHGFDARRMEDGYPEWKQTGMPTEKKL